MFNTDCFCGVGGRPGDNLRAFGRFQLTAALQIHVVFHLYVSFTVNCCQAPRVAYLDFGWTITECGSGIDAVCLARCSLLA